VLAAVERRAATCASPPWWARVAVEPSTANPSSTRSLAGRNLSRPAWQA